MCELPFAEMMICRLVIITYLPWDLSSEWQSHLKDNQKAFAWHEPVLCSKALVFFTVCYCLFITIYELMICVWVATASRLLVLCSFISSILNFDKKKKNYTFRLRVLHKCILQTESYGTWLCSTMKINAASFSELCHSKCYFTQVTPFNRFPLLFSVDQHQE